MSDVKIRSRMLAQLPRVREGGFRRTARIARNSVTVLVGLFALGLMGLVAHFRILPVAAAYPIYAFHDYVFLPVRGWTSTWLFPWSILWWALIGLAVIFALLSFMADQAIIRGAQTLIMRYLMRRSQTWRQRLLRSARLLNRVHIKPNFIRLVAHHELELTLIDISEHKPSNTPSDLTAYMVDLMHMVVELDTYYSQQERLILERLERWNRVLMTLRVYAAVDDWNTYHTSLVDLLPRILSDAPEAMQPDSQHPARSDCYQSRYLTHELHLLCHLITQRTYRIAHLDVRTAGFIQRLVTRTEQRRRLLHAAVATLQHNLRQEHSSALPAMSYQDDFVLHESSRLALSIAAHTTLIARQTVSLAGLQNALDSLALLLTSSADMSLEARHFAALVERPASGERVRRLMNRLLERVSWPPLVRVLNRVEGWLPERADAEGRYRYVHQEWVQQALILAQAPAIQAEASRWHETASFQGFAVAESEFNLTKMMSVESWRKVAPDADPLQTPPADTDGSAS